MTPNPTYEEVCSASTGHTEAVLVVFDPKQTSYEASADLRQVRQPHPGPRRQGNDAALTQYRSAVYWQGDAQKAAAAASRESYAERLKAEGHGEITTEIAEAGPFYYAEEYHQQYLHKHPGGYCGLGGTGVSCPIGLAAAGG